MQFFYIFLQFSCQNQSKLWWKNNKQDVKKYNLYLIFIKVLYLLTWKLNQEDLVKPFSSGNSNGLNCDLFKFLQPSFDRPNLFFFCFRSLHRYGVNMESSFTGIEWQDYLVIAAYFVSVLAVGLYVSPFILSNINALLLNVAIMS